MTIEIDEFIVEEDLWNKAIAGDQSARIAIRKELNGMDLYFHAIVPWHKSPKVVTLRELEDAHLIDRITCVADPARET